MAPPFDKARGAGFGLGLRTAHYTDFLASPQPVDWLEIVTDNFLVEGGKPLAMLERFRRDYPVAMHGVAMSLGAPGGPDDTYLRQVKALADRVQPLWVSDHLCWIGPGPEQLHDLYPLPYTDEAARRVIDAIRRAQDVLQRRLVVENVSSYVAFTESACSEWQFLRHVAQEADCLLLLDVNNVYVSSVNHGFDAVRYLDALPAHRVQQMHLAGHSRHGDQVVDTHDQPVSAAVWQLYRHACMRFPGVATMIERDDNIPPLPELLAELDEARSVAAGAAHVPLLEVRGRLDLGVAAPPGLSALQRSWADYILQPAEALSPAFADRVDAGTAVQAARRLHVYHHAYRARLAEVLADSFERTALYMGGEAFETEAIGHAVHEPPLLRSLGRYGSGFAAYLRQRHPLNPELHELAALDWALRASFDGPDVPALDAAAAASDPAQAWLERPAPLHPSVRLLPVTTNVVALWKALDADDEVPLAQALALPATLAVWRRGLQPHFRSLDADAGAFLAQLSAGASIAQACESLQHLPALADPATLGTWLRDWWADGLLRGDAQQAPLLYSAHSADLPQLAGAQ